MLGALTRIDALTVEDHYYLSTNDEVYCFGEYSAGRGYDGPINQLITNLKHGVDHRSSPRWKYKVEAIEKVGEALAACLPDEFVREATFVPIPPSRDRADPSYDPRTLQMLMALKQKKPSARVMELLRQTSGTRASHASDVRLSIDELKSVYCVDLADQVERPRVVVIFDDILTTGAHFVAARDLLRARLPDALYVGIMVARRKIERAGIELLDA